MKVLQLFSRLVLTPVLRFFWRSMAHLPTWRLVGRLSFTYGSSIAFAGVFCLFVQYFGVMRAFTPEPDVDLWQVNRPPSITFLDNEGAPIGTRGSHYGTPVPLEDLPPYISSAFIATEDRRFYGHYGFDLRGFARAMLANIRARRLVQGGSTITQQLAKNLFLDSDRTIARKTKELHLAFWLESRLSKDEILSLYLNRIYLGAGAYGVEAASNIYFSKSARDLTLAEAALLAGLPKAPTSLAPTRNIEGAITRSHEVLDNLVENGTLNALVTETAKLDPPSLLLHQTNADFGYFFDAVLQESAGLVGDIETDIVISTTLEPAAQQAAIKAMDDIMDAGALALNARQAALVSYDNETGEIIAMMGGRNYEESQFNRATQALRQPGSAFKPFVFLAGLESGLTPETLFVDRPVDVEGWRPRNYGGRYRGGMRLTTAFGNSVNTIAVQVSEITGRDKIAQTVRKMGLTRPLKSHPSIALGAMEVTLAEITAAYLPFAREGRSIQPTLLSAIRTRDGKALYQRDNKHQADVLFNENTGRQMNYLMYQVVKSGTGRRADLARHTVVGKTGTTNDWRDAWFIGYSHHITTGVWVGNDENHPMTEVTGGSIPTALWHHYMEAVHQDLRPHRVNGAIRAPLRHDERRLSQLYGALGDDFIETQNSSVFFGAPGSSRIPEEEPAWREQKKEKKKRKRWFGIF